MDLGDIIELSRFYGRGSDFVIAGGGNTSVKDRERMAIKASGFALRDIGDSGFRRAFAGRGAGHPGTHLLHGCPPPRSGDQGGSHEEPHPAGRGGPPVRRSIPSRDAGVAAGCPHAPVRDQRPDLQRAMRRRRPGSSLATRPSGCPTLIPATAWQSSWRRS